MAKVYPKAIKKGATRALKSRAGENAARRVVEQRFEVARKKMISDFNKHAVTQEIEAGPHAENISGRLGGYGNLFSFIGFSSSDRPISIVREYMQRKPRVYKKAGVRIGAHSVDYTFRMAIPTVSEIEVLAQTPWGGRSWVSGIEKGISGLGYYMYNAQGIGASRSSTGVQLENRLRSMTYRPVKYMTDILKKFRKRVEVQ